MASEKETELLQAAANGDESRVDQLLTEGVSVDCVDSEKRTPLHLAAQGGFIYTVHRLLDENFDASGNELPKSQRRMDVTAQDNEGNTALHLAAMHGHTAVIRALLKDSDINIDGVNHAGQTALNYAIGRNYWQTVKVLLDEEATMPPPETVRFRQVRRLLEKEAARRARREPEI